MEPGRLCSLQHARMDIGAVTLPVTTTGPLGKPVTILRAYALGGRSEYVAAGSCAPPSLSSSMEFIALNGTDAITCGGEAWQRSPAFWALVLDGSPIGVAAATAQPLAEEVHPRLARAALEHLE